jgi:hypothetical protein
VETAGQLGAECTIDQSVACHQALAVERVADQQHLEMGLGTGWDRMLMALVDDLEMQWLEGLGEGGLDTVFAAQVFVSGSAGPSEGPIRII